MKCSRRKSVLGGGKNVVAPQNVVYKLSLTSGAETKISYYLLHNLLHAIIHIYVVVVVKNISRVSVYIYTRITENYFSTLYYTF